MNIGKKKSIEIAPTSAKLNKLNSSNIVKNIFKRNNEKNNMNNNNINKSNHKSKVILLSNNANSDKKQNLNLSDQKTNLFKKMNNINFKYSNNFKSVIYNKKETESRKLNFKTKNQNNSSTIYSVLNHISFSQNKSESNTDKCTDSTSNVTYRNNDGALEKLNDTNNKICRCLSCLLDIDYNQKDSMKNSKINRKLIYDDFIENNEHEEKEKEEQEIIKKCKTFLEKENYEEKKETDNSIIKKTESKDSLIKDKDKKKQNINEDKKEDKVSNSEKKVNDNIKFVVISKMNNNHNNLDIKKINLSLFNSNIVKDKDSLILDSIENPKNNIIKTELNSISIVKDKNNNLRKNKSQNKIISIKSAKNMNLKSNNINKPNNNHPQNKKNLKNLKYINKNNYNSVNDNIISHIKTSININSIKEESKIVEIKDINNKNKNLKIDKKPISKQPSKFNSQNKKILSNKDIMNNSKKKKNSIFDKIKQYYEDCINEEEKLFKNDPKNINKEKNRNNNNANSGKKKVEFKTEFNSDNYLILKLLGRGTYGKTYLVEDPKTKERFALKKININDKIELKENQDEYNLILKLTKEYPDLKIINIYGIELKKLDKYSTVMYVLMEAANCDWEKEIINRCNNNAFYKECQLMYILTELVKTFAILQKNGVSHRDVKPQNILCFGENGYKISDFGEAKNFKKNIVNNKYKNSYAYDDNTMKQTLRGTELYMSPILFQALRYHPYQSVKYNSYKSDVFSLGMCFFLASSLDYEGLYEIREITKNPKKTRFVVNRYLNLKYSQKYINLLISMLQIDEKDRPDFLELEKIIEKMEK